MSLETFDLAVVGAGINGLATAWQAARAGHSVVVLDARPLVNEHNASNDVSKIFRFAYGADAGYVALAKEALVGWRELERESGAALLHQTGLLLWGPRGGFGGQSAATLARLGERVERLGAREIRA
ncbi:MAG: FAD-dependent oxidoreductase, partial [Thermoplasmatota archaeon]